MAETSLVTEPRRSSLEVLKHLESDAFPIDAAFWLFDPESEIWYLYIASSVVNTGGARRAYELTLAALTETESEIPLSQIKVIKPDNPVLKSLRSACKVSGWSWVSFRHNTINGVFIKDAVLLRT